VQAQLEETQSQLLNTQSQLQETLDQLTELKEQLNKPEETDYVQICYDKIKYMDKTVKDRDCIAGEQFTYAQKWITFTLMNAGYTVETQPVSFQRRITIDTLDNAVSKCEVDTYYKREGRNYVEVESKDEATHALTTITSNNIIVKKQGKSDKQIIVGAHYDGDGTGDNGSGVSLALTMAEKLANVETPNTIVFVFFTAEEYGCHGSTTYANAMTDEEVAKTLYMINMDSLICGDYTYLYGGVQDDETQTVSKTGAFDNAMAVAKELGLEFKKNPWTYAQPAPGYEAPDYASPSTGDWSDHVGFKERGIMYVYFEATNWEIPGPYEEYDGYGETYLVGMLMNTANDYLDYIEKYFPGRPVQHLQKFYTLLNALLLQTDVNL
ncbi:MAG: Zn-dependent exopeptidase M28, partial [Clostridia bacterium]|nr:Zn-dependent exopeptidase M28 [Clostridia bacterium]